MRLLLKLTLFMREMKARTTHHLCRITLKVHGTCTREKSASFLHYCQNQILRIGGGRVDFDWRSLSSDALAERPDFSVNGLDGFFTASTNKAMKYPAHTKVGSLTCPYHTTGILHSPRSTLIFVLFKELWVKDGGVSPLGLVEDRGKWIATPWNSAGEARTVFVTLESDILDSGAITPTVEIIIRARWLLFSYPGCWLELSLGVKYPGWGIPTVFYCQKSKKKKVSKCDISGLQTNHAKRLFFLTFNSRKT